MAANYAEDVFEAIHSVMHLYRAQQYRALRDGPHDLTHMESKALGFFVRHPGATLSDLVAHSGRDKAQLTRLIRSLKDRELLVGSADEHDRRSIRLQPTPAGEAIHAYLREREHELSGVAVEALSEEECRQLLALLGKVRHTLEGAAP